MTDNRKKQKPEEISSKAGVAILLFMLGAIACVLLFTSAPYDTSPQQTTTSTQQVAKKNYDLYAKGLCEHVIEKVAQYEVKYSISDTEPWGEHKLRLHYNNAKFQNGFGAWETYNITCEVYDDGELIDFFMNHPNTAQFERPIEHNLLKDISDAFLYKMYNN
jgi:hypothetical protein